MKPVHVVGGGLAGSEAAWALANAGVPVVLHEMRPVRMTDAHKTEKFAELVCSNSFRSDDWRGNAVGLLHEEMRRLGSLVMASAAPAQVPAGSALAVDRDVFSDAVTAALAAHPLIAVERGEVRSLDQLLHDAEQMPVIPDARSAIRDPGESGSALALGPGSTALRASGRDDASIIFCTGPLTSPALADSIRNLTGEDSLAFFDAIAPIVHADSIDFDIAWKQSRYDKEGPGGDKAAYVNCPMDEAQYVAFINALNAGAKTEFREWEKNTPYFEGCLPIEVMAERGLDTLRFGPMKPVGLMDPRVGKRPYAVVQLRQDNKLGTLFNMVGFQTKLKYGAQEAIFRMIPGLQNARFARLGGIHRNTFLNSPKLLDGTLRLRAEPRVRFAGQVTGVEGYVESAAMGMMAGRFAAAERLGRAVEPPPATTALGALLAHVTGGHIEGGKGSFQPMNVNFGLFPEIAAPTHGADGKKLKGEERGRAKKLALAERALGDLGAWLAR
ncbi:MAG TPA: methylenetetrahydrofolate--tRNA-(uracil(54)-C(5))-methyltransferase (FADH(2)-oxidizing) TrmFO [Vitreimonas sp.]|uniref:methylenetetrahydrofolate--tRNA-(uracil(54)- C(5))-methyltransferase (FADH(2)-oxidizing) TrmFO n=1 Tax=Vitreimonas sp. TaxID=3069702 RepID=UPI002D5E8E01|nr:methylenetetrahydrofolate--tRNA-(uracil(54)-C(5))-methyltransferase (FADH(2)-oxidizing) TrmFO [Vitreimonas sp.]HYD86812.1 methylenetetrahydrofolate--tRNA-(uracil(54)-C(5))-methyltransferase (FADH(2)-oxidizing) TrmFO [Vitreimonas sp.]